MAARALIYLFFTLATVKCFPTDNSTTTQPTTQETAKEREVREFLATYNQEYSALKSRLAESEYQLRTNITHENEEIYNKVSLEEIKFRQKYSELAKPLYSQTTNPDFQRQLHFILDIGDLGQKDENKTKETLKLLDEMSAIYSEAKVCLKPNLCKPLDPDIHDIMANSNDYDELLKAWVGWRDETGKKMKSLYSQFVDLYNEAVRPAYKDAGEYWKSWYETPTFEEDLLELLAQIRPLYEHLHAYVRRQLKKIYPQDKFPSTGHIPAHLLGEMWASEWTTLIDRIKPYNASSLDVTDTMKEQGYNVTSMFRTAESFFKSLGWRDMVPAFWTKSMMERPKDNLTEVECHASAWEFSNKSEYAIKMCTSITQEALMIIHHEMGHVQYFMHYEDQPVVYREGANNGFHEAIGDVMALSVQTPEHLKKIGLLKEIPGDSETDINFLMNMAFQKVAFIPFGYLIDQWRWSVFRGDTKPDNYTKDWWDLRCRHQGVSPPVSRTSDDFDPGAKFHVANNVPYIRYFISFIIQFQFHEAACRASGHTGPLHRCDIYESKDAGKLIGDMLKLGRSKPWPDAMEKITGQRKMDAGPLLEYFKPLLQFLIKENGNDYGWDPKCPEFAPEVDSGYKNPLETCSKESVDHVKSDVAEAEKFLLDYNDKAQVLKTAASEAEFNYESNLTEHNKNASLIAQLTKAAFDLEYQQESWKFNVTGMPEHIRRQFKFVRDIGASAQPDKEKLQKLKGARLEMQSVYGKGEVCIKGNCMTLEPGLTQLMATSNDYDELLEAWVGWRDATGRKIKSKYTEYVQLYNEAVQKLCFKDTGEYWRSWYDTPTFEEDIANLYAQIRPLYEQLHAYVRRKLQQKYSQVKFPSTGHIPAHILGNMWAQEWTNLIKDVAPFKDKPTVDVTDELKKQNYTAETIFKTAESFFVSLGLDPMVPLFWNKSIIEKPNGTDMVCHATAYDLYNGKDFRIKMCTDITQENLVIVHHEMGHVQYYMQYKDQPLVFRDGANNGFHEAIGDTMALSVQTPDHLFKINLLKELPNDAETDINFLMKMALEKVAFLPFGYLIDLWRWSVFSNQTTPGNYTEDWWKLRCRLQGISSPVKRSSLDFDPGAKYHVPADTPYIRYFISFIIQFQFHKAACEASGHKGPLHRCDIYQSKEAGKRIGDMLKMGQSKPWPDAMEKITGQRKMDAGPLLEYFRPLLQFLIKENGNDYGWDPQCPEFPPEYESGFKNPLESCSSGQVEHATADVEQAEQFLKEFDKEAELVKNAKVISEFNYESNLTEYNKNESVKMALQIAEFDLRKQKESWKFNISGMPENIRRQFKFVRDIGASAQPNVTKQQLLKNAILEMQSIFGKGKVCIQKDQCLNMDPGLTDLMANSNDYDLLLKAWKGWRDVTGPKMKDLFTEFVLLYNEALRISCFKDAGEYWRSWYDSPTFEEDMDNLYVQIRPLYEQLHAYVRRKLQQKYSQHKFPASGHIPAHILGNMWAQQWTSIIRDVVPFKNRSSVDVSDELKKQNYTARKIFEAADEFFGSLGLARMVPEFWQNSIIEKQNGTDMICHGTAYDFYNGKDFRIKMCTTLTQESLVTVHHEMGHVEYYMQYKDQPQVFREGANNGFHEAIGDTMALSVQTPEHLFKIGLLKELPSDNETDINFLLKMALEKVAFLPFGYLIDLWRWSVFSGKTTPEKYTEDWWKLRCRLQGVYSPVKRSSTDFDPGSKYHIPSNTPYIRYFISFIIQFQFHKAACEASGHKGPLHRCDIYQSKEAGKRIGDMLKLGASRPWPEAMEVITGQRKMDASALMEYFRPLMEFLRKENRDDFGWSPHCPDLEEKPQPPANTKTQSGNNSSKLATVSAFFFMLLTITLHLVISKNIMY
ncbi:angiotensin-converting enzyme-like [Biomphalaria glabrata]|uniref:Angiotensin-converting enzyme n=1 Tax=Biomphalaria glabrata TaxID=6526 RepID=A0A9W2Z1V4_BIOGL|nr:angiotensin-converting enzyme-like [Biomphalaria glabrata]